MWPFALVFVFIVPIFAVCCLFPFVSLLINATKTQSDFTSAFGLGFGKTFALWDNIVTVFTYGDGIFARWLVNTLIYVVVGEGGVTLLAIMGGYALAKFRFPGRKAVFAVIIGAISVSGIALAALFTIVATWNDCFLPLIMLKDSDWFPLTIGLNQWKDQASTAGGWSSRSCACRSTGSPASPPAPSRSDLAGGPVSACSMRHVRLTVLTCA